jgi:FkbM family methyltransferase
VNRRNLEQLPALRDVRQRERAIQVSRRLKRLRRGVYEAAGSSRYSRPQLAELDRYLDFDGGFFVEAGANDGFRQSNTYFLERFRRWRGVLIEPIPELFRECTSQRPGSTCFNCALVGTEHTGETALMRFSDLASHVLGADGPAPGTTCFGWAREYDVRVPARTLTSVLDEVDATAVDFLSLDLEGFEDVALSGLDLDRHRPRFILLEAFDGARLDRCLDALGGRYRIVSQIGTRDLLLRMST